jgi:hypothetical protein
MSREGPATDCGEITFGEPYLLSEAAEVSLEDYARVLSRASRAEAVPATDGQGIAGVHLCGLLARPAPPVLEDVEGFARELARGAPGSGLGWG